MTGVIDDAGKLVVYPSASRMVLLVIGGLGFVGLGVWLLFLPESEQEPGAAIVGYIGIVFFGACAAYGVFRLLVKRPALIVDARGLTDNGSALGVGLLRWDEIATIGEYRFRGQTMLGIVPRNLERVLSRVGPFKRFALRANLRLGAAPLNIPQMVLPVPVGDLVEAIAKRYDVNRGEAGAELFSLMDAANEGRR